MNATVLRTWCMKRPRPDAIKLTFDNGDEKLFPRPGQSGQSSWQEAAESIAALEPTLLEALGKDGEVLRAIKGSELDKDGKQRNERVAPPPALHSDPETARLCYTADLLHRAYQHATDVAFERIDSAYSTAFDRLVQLVEKVDDRNARIEQRLERAEANYRAAMQERIDDALDAAAEKAGVPGGLSGLLEYAGPMIAGFLQGQSEGKPPEAPPKKG